MSANFGLKRVTPNPIKGFFWFKIVVHCPIMGFIMIDFNWVDICIIFWIFIVFTICWPQFSIHWIEKIGHKMQVIWILYHTKFRITKFKYKLSIKLKTVNTNRACCQKWTNSEIYAENSNDFYVNSGRNVFVYLTIIVFLNDFNIFFLYKSFYVQWKPTDSVQMRKVNQTKQIKSFIVWMCSESCYADIFKGSESFYSI